MGLRKPGEKRSWGGLYLTHKQIREKNAAKTSHKKQSPKS